jgi:hypothetical protein
MTEKLDMHNPEQKIVLDFLDREIAFHRKWRRAIMSLYYVINIGAVFCSTGATMVAMYGSAKLAGMSAGLATLFISIDKLVLSREKWRVHVTIETHLNNLKVALLSRRSDIHIVVDKIQSITEQYATELPIEPREYRSIPPEMVSNVLESDEKISE